MRIFLSIILPLFFTSQLWAQFDMLPADSVPVMKQTTLDFQMCPPEPPVVKVIAPVVCDKRPVLWAYLPQNDYAALSRLEEVETTDFFNVKEIHNVPDWAVEIGETRGYPIYHWQTPKSYKSDSHYSAELLIERYKASQQPEVFIKPETPVATYPVARPRWNVEGDWNPSKAKVISHLLSHNNHRGKYDRAWLEQLSLAQLRTLHDDDHDKRVSRVLLPQNNVKQTVRLRSSSCPTCPR